MTDGGIYIMEDGRQFKKFSAKDGLGIKLAIKSGVEVGIISHSLVSEMVTSRANTLGMAYFYVGQRPKEEVLAEWMEKLNIAYEEVAFIGDDLNDFEIMQKVGFAACPADAVDAIKKISNVVLEKGGGESAVREFIDRFILD